MGCCNQVITNLLTGVTGGGGSDPVLSDYCVQWVSVDSTAFFPGGDNNEINGNTNSGEITSGEFTISNFNGNTGHTFYYRAIGTDNTWYAQVIRPSSDPALSDLGSYSFDFNGNPSGPIPIIPTNENCVLRTFRAVFTVDDVSVDAFSGITYEAFDLDLAPDNPFNSVNINALLLAQIGSNMFGPDGTVDIQLSGNQVTMTIQSLTTVLQGRWDAAAKPETFFNFTEI